MAGTRSFVIRQVLEERVPAILQFHTHHLTPYIWPRTLEEFSELAAHECLFEAVELVDGAEKLVGTCYIKIDEEPASPGRERLEFGGAFVTDECRGLGLATALGIVAISNQVAWDQPRGRLVGHVHEANPLPRGL